MITQVVAGGSYAVIIILRNYYLAVKLGLTCKQSVKHRLCKLVYALCAGYHIRIGITLGEYVKLLRYSLLA